MGVRVQVEAIVGKIRKLVGDDITPYRKADTTIFSYLDDAQANVIGDHPEAQYIDAVNHDDLVPITSLTQYLQVSSDFANAVRDYAVSKLMAEDQEDTANLALSNNSIALSEKEMQ